MRRLRPRKRPWRPGRSRRRGRLGGLGVLLVSLGALVLTFPRQALLVGLAVVALAVLLWWLRRQHRRQQQRALLQVDLSGVDAMEPRQFERFVAALLAVRGFRTELTQASHDYGVDVVASLGPRRIAVQVKHYRSAVSNGAIAQALLGMPHYDCSEVMVVTNSVFTRHARRSAALHPCTLVDRDVLAQWLVDSQDPSAASD